MPMSVRIIRAVSLYKYVYFCDTKKEDHVDIDGLVDNVHNIAKCANIVDCLVVTPRRGSVARYLSVAVVKEG